MKLIHRLALFFLFALTASAQNDLPAMKRITGTNTPAHIAARGFMRGANIANYLEVPPGGGWSIPHTVVDLQRIRAEGFDHIRLPVAWHRYTGPGPEFKLSDRIFAKVDYMVTNATALGLNVIINIHNFDEFTTDPGPNTAWFEAIWRQVAAHYAASPSGVAFELINEPKDAATTVLLNPIYAETIRLIRQTNPHRTIFVGPGRWNSAEELVNLRLPDDDDNLIVTVHCYDPFHFTHQGASWAGPDVLHVTGIVFPGPPAVPLKPAASLHLNPWVLDWIDKYNTYAAETNPSSPIAFIPKIQQARAWSEEFGRPGPPRGIRGLHEGRPGVTRPVLRRISPGAGRVGHRLGNLGLEIGIQLLGHQSPPTTARDARGTVSRKDTKGGAISGIWFE